MFWNILSYVLYAALAIYAFGVVSLIWSNRPNLTWRDTILPALLWPLWMVALLTM